jgi:hypothetical protein
MRSAKEEVQSILERLPDDVSLEEIQYHIHVLQKVGRGEADLQDGRRLSQAEVEQSFARCLEKL